MFIGGTIHLLSKDDYPLPSSFNLAFNASEDIIFETDIESAQSLTTQAKFLQVLMYQDGKTIEDDLKPETYDALVAFLEDRNLPVSMFTRFTPAGINMTLVVLELQGLGITGESGVEAYFNSQSKAQEKDVMWLETIDEQVSFIGRINDLDADLVTNSTLRDIKKLKDEWPKLLSAWREGDMDRLESLAINEMINESPELYQFLLADRNKNWVPEIKRMLDSPEVEFVLVGALHLAGKDSVLTMLANEGFKIEQLD
ncbi:TraB/GumN family protein [Arenicella sp. 4NH20-0111]